MTDPTAICALVIAAFTLGVWIGYAARAAISRRRHARTARYT